MNKIIKRKLIGAVICFGIGIACLIFLAVSSGKISEELLSYLSGFSSGIIAVGTVTLIKYIRVMKNEKMSKKLENANNDERLKVINNESMAISFRISVVAEAIISIICAVNNKMEIAEYLGFAICFQLIVYLITYFIISKKN